MFCEFSNCCATQTENFFQTYAAIFAEKAYDFIVVLRVKSTTLSSSAFLTNFQSDAVIQPDNTFLNSTSTQDSYKLDLFSTQTKEVTVDFTQTIRHRYSKTERSSDRTQTERFLSIGYANTS